MLQGLEGLEGFGKIRNWSLPPRACCMEIKLRLAREGDTHAVRRGVWVAPPPGGGVCRLATAEGACARARCVPAPLAELVVVKPAQHLVMACAMQWPIDTCHIHGAPPGGGDGGAEAAAPVASRSQNTFPLARRLADI